MHYFFNGQSFSLKIPSTLESILLNHSIAIDTPGIAIACNEVIILRSKWKTLPVHSGDRIEVVHAIHGG